MTSPKTLSIPDEFEIPEAAKPKIEQVVKECQSKINSIIGFLLTHCVLTEAEKNLPFPAQTLNIKRLSFD